MQAALRLRNLTSELALQRHDHCRGGRHKADWKAMLPDGSGGSVTNSGVSSIHSGAA